MTGLTMDDVRAAVLGGAVLGGGGGGSMQNGLGLGELAIRRGPLEMVSIEEMPEEAQIVTCSYVGSPAAEHICVRPEAYLRTLEMLCEAGVRVDGLISNECGGTAVVNGWLQAAVLGVPLVDAPCNGRAHPTGVMGAMGLHRVEGYTSIQAAAGGDEDAGRYVEVLVRAGLEEASALVRQAAVQAGGMVAVARNPVSAGYVRTHTAPGAIGMCIQLGRTMLAAQHQGGIAVCQAAGDFLDGEILAVEEVRAVELASAGGFDSGSVLLGDYELTFWNEYMTLEHGGERLATFPDLIMTLDAERGQPLTSAEIREGNHVALLVVPKGKLILGAGMRDPDLLRPAETLLGKALRVEDG
jgi:DUF917 family protein